MKFAIAVSCRQSPNRCLTNAQRVGIGPVAAVPLLISAMAFGREGTDDVAC